MAVDSQSRIDEAQLRGNTRKSKRVPWRLKPISEDYSLRNVLGTGHFGVVYSATHKETGDIYAIKSLDKSHPEFNLEDVRNEVKVLETVCDHPNIATIYEVYEDAEHIFLVQEACLGGELFDLVIERKHFTEGDAARACQTLISIISHCHFCGVLHRDIKPENFLLKSILGSEEGRFDGSDVRAVDFGLSIFTKDRLIVHDIVGSSYYIAPEILAGEPYSPAADAWSLGVVVFILISGYPPFWGSSDAVIYDRIQNQELDVAYEPWTTDAVSLEAADFVKKLLTKDPLQRMTLDEAAQHPWLIKAETDNNNSANGSVNGLSAPLATAIVERLRAFTRENRLTCLLMTLVAHHLSDTAIGQLRRTFYSLDEDEDGLISVADITKALQATVAATKRNNLESSSTTTNRNSTNSRTSKDTDNSTNARTDKEQDDIAELIDQLNEAVSVGTYMAHNKEHHIGQVNVDEFLAAALDRKKVLTTRTISAVFNMLDEKNEGKLNMTVLSTALAECGVPVPESTLRSMLAREGALDGAGVVSARSFQNLLVAGAEEHQNRPAAVALNRILSGDLDLDFDVDNPVNEEDILVHKSGGSSTISDGSGTMTPSPISSPQQEGRSPSKTSQQNLKLITNTSCRPLKVSIAPQRSDSVNTGLASETPRGERSTGATLDEVLKQYGATSGYRTPRRRKKEGAGGSASASPSPMKGTAEEEGGRGGGQAQQFGSKASTPSSVASPSIACLGWD